MLTALYDTTNHRVNIECDTLGAEELIRRLQRLIAEGDAAHTHIYAVGTLPGGTLATELSPVTLHGQRAAGEVVIDYFEGDLTEDIEDAIARGVIESAGA